MFTRFTTYFTHILQCKHVGSIPAPAPLRGKQACGAEGAGELQGQVYNLNTNVSISGTVGNAKGGEEEKYLKKGG